MFHSQPQSLALAARKFAMQRCDDDKRGGRVPDKACPIISRPIIRISKIPGSAEKAQCRESRTGFDRFWGTVGRFGSGCAFCFAHLPSGHLCAKPVGLPTSLFFFSTLEKFSYTYSIDSSSFDSLYSTSFSFLFPFQKRRLLGTCAQMFYRHDNSGP